MKIIERKIEKTGENLFVCMDEVLLTEFEIARFDEAQIRELIVYLKKNRPELICPIMCEDCTEHAEQTEAHNHCYNIRECGK
jgi:hypothetical protein